MIKKLFYGDVFPAVALVTGFLVNFIFTDVLSAETVAMTGYALSNKALNLK